MQQPARLLPGKSLHVLFGHLRGGVLTQVGGAAGVMAPSAERVERRKQMLEQAAGAVQARLDNSNAQPSSQVGPYASPLALHCLQLIHTST